MQPTCFRTSRLIAIAFAAGLAAAMTMPAQAQDKPAAPAAPAAAAAAPAASAGDAAKPAEAKPADAKPADAAAQDGKKKKKKSAANQAPRSLEARHQVCLAFIQRHGLSCDPWVVPTCGADTGYFRPLECVRPRSQQ